VFAPIMVMFAPSKVPKTPSPTAKTPQIRPKMAKTGVLGVAKGLERRGVPCSAAAMQPRDPNLLRRAI
jgi:hypothetical protein